MMLQLLIAKFRINGSLVHDLAATLGFSPIFLEDNEGQTFHSSKLSFTERLPIVEHTLMNEIAIDKISVVFPILKIVRNKIIPRS